MAEYKIIGTHRILNEPEEIDTTDNEKDALYLMDEYKLAFGPDWRITIEYKPSHSSPQVADDEQDSPS